MAVGHATHYYSPSVVRSRAETIRGRGDYHYFNPDWYRFHGRAWVAQRWVNPNLWFAPAWTTLAAFCQLTGPPIVYDYGSNLVIQNDAVYYNGDPIASAADYAAQAEAIADAGRQAAPPPTDQWQPLGVFGIVQGDDNSPQRILQLALDPTGVIRGNYYDPVADNNLPVYGQLDPKTQRMAWSVGEQKNVVFETTLGNLTQPQTSVLVHFGKDRTEQMLLVRLDPPK